MLLTPPKLPMNKDGFPWGTVLLGVALALALTYGYNYMNSQQFNNQQKLKS